MALTLEDGTGIATAESYVDAVALTTYAANNGLTIPGTDPEKEALLRRAFIEMNAIMWKGCAVFALQRGSWPRYGVVRDGFTVDATTIPAAIKDGQMALAAEIYDDDVNPREQRKGAVTKQRVEGAVEVQYSSAPSSVTSKASTRQSWSHFSGYMISRNQASVVRA